MSGTNVAPAGSRYQDQRQFVVPATLDELRGPASDRAIAVPLGDEPSRARTHPPANWAIVDAFHQALAEIGLRATAGFGFALAGGYAVQAHQILTRPSEDVGLFTAWERRGDFTTAVDAVVAAYRAQG